MSEQQGLEFKRLAADADALQRSLIKARAKPHERKTMRFIPTNEAAWWLGLSPSRFRQIVTEDEAPEGVVIGGNNRRGFSTDDLAAFRRMLQRGARGGEKYRVGRQEGDALQVISFGNFKGGSGKTTHSIHLAQYLALKGYRVLAIDLDPQASMTGLFGVSPDIEFSDEDEEGAPSPETIYSVFSGDCTDLHQIIRTSHINGLDFVPANTNLHKAEYELPARQARGDLSSFHMILFSALNSIRDEYDVVVMDCPPSLNYVAINALYATTGLIVPVPPHMLDFASTGRYFDLVGDLLLTIARLRDDRAVSKDYDFVRVLVPRHDRDSKNQAMIVRMMSAHFADYLMLNFMLRSDQIDLSGAYIETLYETSQPSSRGAYQRALEAMNLVNEEIEQGIISVWEASRQTGAKSSDAA